VFAWDPESSVFRIVSFAWAGFGASFGPVVLLSLFWKKTNKWGALCGIISGGAMVFIWKFGIATLGGIFTIYELLPAFIVNLVVTVVVSIATGGADKETEEVFDEVNELIKENKAAK
jgi:sodium/proline symporter